MEVNMLFELRGNLSKQTGLYIEIIGFCCLLIIWYLLPTLNLISNSILPSPVDVLKSFKELHFEDGLIRNLGYSIYLNLTGYVEAVMIAIPLGFIIGLFPLFRKLSERYVSAVRYLPLTAMTGIFIAWFGIYDNMKIQFLTFGIIVYLLPVVIQRIDEVQDVYIQTVQTLGASKLQIIINVFIPAVISKLSDDIRVLVAISWTYIIIAELLNKTGGIGAMAYMASRQSRIDKVYAILFIIMFIGFLQDKLFTYLDKIIFPYKYQGGK